MARWPKAPQALNPPLQSLVIELKTLSKVRQICHLFSPSFCVRKSVWASQAAEGLGVGRHRWQVVQVGQVAQGVTPLPGGEWGYL